jgi:hypothetical protein
MNGPTISGAIEWVDDNGGLQTVRFRIYPDTISDHYQFQQWGAATEACGHTLPLVEAMCDVAELRASTP